MTDLIGVVRTDWLDLALYLGLGVLLLLLVFETKRKRSTILRFVATILAVISVLALVLQPYYFIEADATTRIILTPGYQYADSLRKLYPDNQVVFWSDSIRETDLSKQLIIDGFGIPEYAQYRLAGKEVKYLKPNLPQGILAVDYPEQIEVGGEFELVFKANIPDSSMAKLYAYGQVVDSVMLISGMGNYALTFRPQTTGKYTFSLELGEENNQLPALILPKNEKRILLLSQQPTFETRFLKNHLIEQGYKVFVKSQLTTDRYKYENVGFEFDRIGRLNKAVLKEFDILICDDETLAKLSRQEQNNVKEAIINGLGFLMLLSEEQRKLPSWLKLSLSSSEDEKITIQLNQKEIELETGDKKINLLGLQEEVFPDNNSLAVRQPYGLGVIGVSVLQSSYKLVLKGDKEAYETLWEKLIDPLNAKSINKYALSPELIFADEPVDLSILGISEIPEVRYQGAAIPVRQHEFVPDRWSARLWPNNPGWNKLEIDSDSIWFFVHASKDWVAVQNFQTMNVNSAFLNQDVAFSTETVKTRRVIPIWIWLLLFLTSMGYLWLEPKLR